LTCLPNTKAGEEIIQEDLLEELVEEIGAEVETEDPHIWVVEEVEIVLEQEVQVILLKAQVVHMLIK
jgi:hypothetical protein